MKLKTYSVGGSVRDRLLGLTPSDYDYVVIDVTESELLSRGFVKVGCSHDIFLHPETKDEYTLAKRNSLDEELNRRDLTINSIAIDQDDYEIYDPLGGVEDLNNMILRHNPHFLDDPLRVLRLLRFKARFKKFSIAPETELLLSRLIQNKKLLKEVAKERITSELIKSVNSDYFNDYFDLINLYLVSNKIFPFVLKLSTISDSNSLTFDEKLAISISSHSLENIKAFLQSMAFSNQTNKFVTTFKQILNLSTEKKNLLNVLELMGWNKDIEYFCRFDRCLVNLKLVALKLELTEYKEALKGLNLEDIASTSKSCERVENIIKAKKQALRDS